MAGALAALALAVPAASHSWIQQLNIIDPTTGTFVGAPGYPRNNTLRTDPKFSDLLMVHILPTGGAPAIEQRDLQELDLAQDTKGILKTDRMCKRTQEEQYQSPGSPMLEAAPGDLIALQYLENGHVTLPQNQPGKPPNRGNVYIYGTTQPKSPELFLDVFGQWSADGNGGDKRGKLLATQSYDDGNCYQVNSGSISAERQKKFPSPTGEDLMCQNDIALPSDLPVDQLYTLFWVWDWPTEPGPNAPNGIPEIYTSCIDVKITANKTVKRDIEVRDGLVSSAGFNNQAISSYMSSLTNSVTPATKVAKSTPVPATPNAASPVVSAATQSPAQVAPPPASPTSAMKPPSDAVAVEQVMSFISAAVEKEHTITVTVHDSGSTPVAASRSIQAASIPSSAAAASVPAAAQQPATSQRPSVTHQPPSMPPASLALQPPILLAVSNTTPTTTATRVIGSKDAALPAFSGTATPVAASPAPKTALAAAAGKRNCNAKNCKSKKRSRIFGASVKNSE